MEADSIVAVTGAGGFIGHSVYRRLIADKVAVRGLVRYRSDLPGEFQFDLANQVMDPAAFSAPIRAVVHCAWEDKVKDMEESRRINVEGTRWLVDCCKKAGIGQIVFVSSLAAYAEAESVYGRTKWEAEEFLLSLPNAATFSTVIASGMVVGRGGAFSQARTAVKLRTNIPVFHKSSLGLFPTVFIDDLIDAIASSITNRVTGRLCVGDGNGVSLTDFYQGIGLLDGGKPSLFTFPGVNLLPQRILDMIAKPPGSTDHMLDPSLLQQIDFASGKRLPGCKMTANFWQSLERLAVLEGNEKGVGQIREFAARRGNNPV